ncbi:hypothetical protein D9V30_00150 [Mycetocola reblochoni]|uniref:Uncharacterized protein n=1 Tax=Mycetocola reblochoni TaxID=331618 RepID=A0A3L6ZSG0_9MICO|nr:hypothetical protein [Mycetocola reblochoni]RLP70883.1 hypothetical protein D9V30_00150 [Mycetocola reblochoni]
MSERDCLQCGESQAAIRASQSARDPIFCGAVDYFGECEWEQERHRFRDWSDKKLIEEARGKFRSLDGVVVVSPRLLSRLADALEAAKERRVVRSKAELLGLRKGSVVVDRQGVVAVVWGMNVYEFGESLVLPATVLYTPEVTR